jgi:hypothetical protein
MKNANIIYFKQKKKIIQSIIVISLIEDSVETYMRYSIFIRYMTD